jgi:hypothetical protein
MTRQQARQRDISRTAREVTTRVERLLAYHATDPDAVAAEFLHLIASTSLLLRVIDQLIKDAPQ